MNSNKILYKYIFLSILLVFTSSFVNAQITLGGTITTDDGWPISNAHVFLGNGGPDNQSTFTNGSGYYEFTVPEGSGSNFIITPYSNSNPFHGVTTFDFVKIVQHVEGIDTLESPYLIIAADIDHSNSVDTGDVNIITDINLFLLPGFPNNTSWRFVEAAFIFPEPTNPFLTGIPEMVSVNGTENQTNIDFIGIKVGDINGPAGSGGAIQLDPCDLACGQITGKVYFDEDENCTLDTLEQGLENWLVTAISEDFTAYTFTDELGAYLINVDTGDYEVTITSPNDLWTACENTQEVIVEEEVQYPIDFLMQVLYACPDMQVEIAAPGFRPCFESYYKINYCNQGTVPVTDAWVEVTFDTMQNITGASPPWSSQNGSTYIFDIGNVAVNECGFIYVDLTTSCDAILGQTLCAEAHIYPDTICVPPPDLWDGSSLKLSADCDGDSIRFEILNIGDPMSLPGSYIVIEDDMIMMTEADEPIQLDAQENFVLAFPANGSTWRLELDQSPDHPQNAMISASVEGCGLNGAGEFSLGFITIFPQYTESNAVDVECVEVTSSFDPNDKSAIPAGVDAEHFIERNVGLDYRIRFQNTGTDTAFNVVIRDTLSSWLDVASVRPGVSSHDYEFNILEGHVLEFRFSNIMLPDSNVNEVLSHGFVKFSIAQVENNPLGTVIENSAAIYFDFNDPVITNTVFHTIGENFLEILDNIILEPTQHFNIKLYPNLIQEFAILKLDGIQVENGTLVLYDLTGRPLVRQSFHGDAIEFHKNNLLSGMYLFEIYEGSNRLSFGKLMIH